MEVLLSKQPDQRRKLIRSHSKKHLKIFFEAVTFLNNHHAKMGRSNYPIEKYLRLMHLKYRYNYNFKYLRQLVIISFGVNFAA